MFNSSLIKPRRRHILRGFIQVMFFMFYGLGEAHSEQNLPVFTVPQEQVHSADGFGLAHSEQNLHVCSLIILKQITVLQMFAKIINNTYSVP